jgi:hypothetical protein
MNQQLGWIAKKVRHALQWGLIPFLHYLEHFQGQKLVHHMQKVDKNFEKSSKG